MKTKLLSLLSLLLVCSTGNALAQWVTPFTPRKINSEGEKEYVWPQKRNTGRISVSMGWGYDPVTSRTSYINEKFPFYYGAGIHRIQSDVTSNLGSFQVAVNYEITPWLELTVPISYAPYHGYVRPYHAPDEEGIITQFSGRMNGEFISLTPGLKINWLRNDWLSIYSRAGVGVGLANFWEGSNFNIVAKCTVSWQASPVGIEMGSRRLYFFVEGGYGYLGTVMAGVKLKIGKTREDGKIDRGRKVEWYEKYLY